MVGPPAASAPSWAAASTPCARPLTTVMPRAAPRTRSGAPGSHRSGSERGSRRWRSAAAAQQLHPALRPERCGSTREVKPSGQLVEPRVILVVSPFRSVSSSTGSDTRGARGGDGDRARSVPGPGAVDRPAQAMGSGLSPGRRVALSRLLAVLAPEPAPRLEHLPRQGGGLLRQLEALAVLAPPPEPRAHASPWSVPVRYTRAVRRSWRESSVRRRSCFPRASKIASRVSTVRVRAAEKMRARRTLRSFSTKTPSRSQRTWP